MQIGAREARDEDRAFIEALQVAVLADELGASSWEPRLQDAVMRFQLEARQSCFQALYPDARYQIVLVDGESAGIVLAARRKDEIRLAEVAVTSGRRGMGVGRAILAALIAEAEACGKPLRLHVRRANPAAGLYLRMGFRVIGHDAGHAEMEYTPDTAGQKGRPTPELPLRPISLQFERAPRDFADFFDGA